MKRRGFLAGILAAGVAPAIVHNPMKIFVPKQDIVVPSLGQGSNMGRGLTSAIYHVDEAPFLTAYNLSLSRQDEFGEAFFPTVVVEPDENGIGGLVDFRRNADDFDRIAKANMVAAEQMLKRKNARRLWLA